MSERHFGTVGGEGCPSTDWSRSPLAICASIVSRFRSAVSGATVETLPFRRNNSLYSATVMSCAEIVWLPTHHLEPAATQMALDPVAVVAHLPHRGVIAWPPGRVPIRRRVSERRRGTIS